STHHHNASATTAGTAAATGEKKEASSTAAKGDLNTATKEELGKLPGIADATAGKIIAGRPYTSKKQVVQKEIVSQANYNKFHNMVVAHRAGTPAATSTKAQAPKTEGK